MLWSGGKNFFEKWANWALTVGQVIGYSLYQMEDMEMKYSDEENARAIVDSMIDIIEDEIDERNEQGAIDCPACGGDTGNFMGYLGNLAWFRCQRCGTEASVRIEPKDDEGWR